MATGQYVFDYTAPGENRTRVEAGCTPYYYLNQQYIPVDPNNLDWSVSRGALPCIFYNSTVTELPHRTVFHSIPRIRIAGYYEGPNFTALNQGEEARYVYMDRNYEVATEGDIEFVKGQGCTPYILTANNQTRALRPGTAFTTQSPLMSSQYNPYAPAPQYNPSQYAPPYNSYNFAQPNPPQYVPAPQPNPPQYAPASQYNPPQYATAPQYNPSQYATAPQYNPPQYASAPQYNPPQCAPAPQYNPPQYAQNGPVSQCAPAQFQPSYNPAPPNASVPHPDTNPQSSNERLPGSQSSLQLSVPPPPHSNPCAICKKPMADFFRVFTSSCCLDCLAKKINNQELCTGAINWSGQMIKEIYDRVTARRPDLSLIPIPNPSGMVVCYGKDAPEGPGYPPRGHFTALGNIVAKGPDSCPTEGHTLCTGCANRLTNCPLCNEYIYFENHPGGCPSGEAGGCATFTNPCIKCGKTWPHKKRVRDAPEALSEEPAKAPEPAQASAEVQAKEPEKQKVEDAKVEESKDQGPKLEEPKRSEVNA